MTIVYLSGPHGAGKTTLIEQLVRENDFIVAPELVTKTPKFDAEPFERLVLKFYQRSIENYEVWETAKKNSDKIVIGNRCIYDALCYTEAYHKLGWITADDREYACKLAEQVFWQRKPYAIVLNPGLEEVKTHLEKRWKEGKKKWREEDMEYLREAINAFAYYKFVADVFYVTSNSQEDRQRIGKWLESIKNSQQSLRQQPVNLTSLLSV